MFGSAEDKKLIFFEREDPTQSTISNVDHKMMNSEQHFTRATPA